MENISAKEGFDASNDRPAPGPTSFADGVFFALIIRDDEKFFLVLGSFVPDFRSDIVRDIANGTFAIAARSRGPDEFDGRGGI